MKDNILIFTFLIFMISCDPDCDKKIDIEFRQFIDGQELILNNLNYQNLASNIYSVERLLYVISNLILHCENGESIPLNNYYFIDIDKIELNIVKNRNLLQKPIIYPILNL